MRPIRTLLSAAAVVFAATVFPIHTALAAPTADLSVKVSGSPNPVFVGWLVTWTVTVTNHGPNEASGVELTASYGSDGGAFSADTSQGTCEHGGGFIAFALGTIDSGASAVASVVVIDYGGDGGSLWLSASATTTDPNPANNSAVGHVNTISGPTPPISSAGSFCAPAGGVATGMGGTSAGSSAAPLITLLILALAGIAAGAVRLVRH